MAACRIIGRTARQVLQPKVIRNDLVSCLCTANLLSEKVTHTGQKFDNEDWRKVRFVDKSKLVNENVAINLIEEEPPLECDARVVSCNGGGGALGHPKVFINLDKPGIHDCGYCGLRFTKKTHH